MVRCFLRYLILAASFGAAIYGGLRPDVGPTTGVCVVAHQIGMLASHVCRGAWPGKTVAVSDLPGELHLRKTGAFARLC
jgi:hypothetical protein